MTSPASCAAVTAAQPAERSVAARCAMGGSAASLRVAQVPSALGLHPSAPSKLGPMKAAKKQKNPISGVFSKPASGLETETPPYHALRSATGRNRRQRFGRDFAVFAAARFATACHGLQPRGSIKA